MGLITDISMDCLEKIEVSKEKIIFKTNNGDFTLILNEKQKEKLFYELKLDSGEIAWT